MPRIPNKLRKSFAIASNVTSLVVTGSEHYTGFSFQFVGLAQGLTVKLLASLNNTNFGVLNSSFSVTTAAGTVEVLELHAPFSGGLKLDLAGNNATGTIIVFMHGPAYSSMNR
jgi:hypothetical protein